MTPITTGDSNNWDGENDSEVAGAAGVSVLTIEALNLLDKLQHFADNVGKERLQEAITESVDILEYTKMEELNQKAIYGDFKSDELWKQT